VTIHETLPVVGMTGTCLVMATDDAKRAINTYLGAFDQLSAREIFEAALLGWEWLYIEGYLLTDNV
jgi:sugar/nucleoside kinase (ribokinase family)